ncbi:MAG: hypothetical protein ACM3PT_13690 [Deltaproteobacteria bacterium]
MKKIRLFFGLLLILHFISCNKDNLEDIIVGTWNATSLKTTNCRSEYNNKYYIFTNGCVKNIGELGSYMCITMTFTENGTYTLETKTFVNTKKSTGNYKITDGKVSICGIFSTGDCEEDTLVFTKSQMTITGTNSDTSCRTELKLKK